MITFLGLVRQGDSYLPGEGVLVDGGNRSQVQVEDDGFFFRIAESLFYLSYICLLRSDGILAGCRLRGVFLVGGFFLVPAVMVPVGAG